MPLFLEFVIGENSWHFGSWDCNPYMLSEDFASSQLPFDTLYLQALCITHSISCMNVNPAI